MTTFIVVVAVALAVLIPNSWAGIPLPALASRARSKNIAGDAFQKGYRSRLLDAVEQTDLDESTRLFNRAATGQIAERDANIAAGPDGYVAAGEQQIGKSGEYDRGMLAVNRTREIRQVGDMAQIGIDSGNMHEERRSMAEIAKIPGAVSAGAKSARNFVNRHQDMADTEHVDQFARAELLDEEQYDRGVTNKAAGSQANIIAGGLASGSSSADFAATRDRSRLVNTIPDAGIIVDQRHVDKANRVVNAVASSKAAESGAVFAPLGAAGRDRALEDVRSHQAAVHKGIVEEYHALDAPVERHMQSDWVKGNVASEAAIDALAGVASGNAAKQIATGFDQSDSHIQISNRAAKRTATDSTEFDDRHDVRARDSTTVFVS